MTAPPQVSVGIPVFNGERFLPATLDHLLAQDFGDIEIVISDNGSTDGTEEIARKAAAADERVRYHRSPVNRGMAWNYNRTLELARAPLFMWNSADDLVEPGYLGACVRALTDRPDAVLAFARMRYVDEDGRDLRAFHDEHLDLTAGRPHERIEALLRSEAFHAVYGVTPTELLRSFGGLPSVRGDDVVLGVRMLLRGTFVLVPEPLMRVRLHHQQAAMIGDVVEQVKEHDPRSTARFAFPLWRFHAELYRQVLRSALPWHERLRCAAVVLRAWSLRKWRQLASDVKRNVAVLVAAARSRRTA